MANFKATGDRIDYTPTSAVSAGDVIVLAGKIFLATEDIAANELGSLQAYGIITLLKAAPLVIAVGDHIYWHATGVSATSTDALADLGLSVFAAASAAVAIDYRMV